ncbi:MAG: hypothetical protein K8R73_17185 [Clostridiales bacterium]|nr:hypothetical protein [Clostridiales bacterium]
MNYTKGKIGILVLVGVVFLSGCTKLDDQTASQDDPITMPAIEEPIENPDSNGDETIGETTLRGAEFSAKIDGIESIVLKDVEGNIIDRNFTDEEIEEIKTAFNDSFIMDTAYIEMITGYNMTIELENGEEVFITSYGDPVFIVARIGDETYHLGCEAIATILLEGMN